MSADEIAVLLIEDNPGDVRLIEELLDGRTDRSSTRIGELRRADSLADGLRRLDDEGADVVLLDLGLPDSTGIATLEAVHDRSSEVPIVVLTGLNDERIGDRAVHQGAQEYLVKDELTSPLLRRSLRHAVERKRFERTQSALHTASRDFIQAQSDAEVSALAVDTAVDVLDFPGVAIYLFDDASNELRPAAITDSAKGVFGEIPSFGPDDTAITWRTFIDGETTAVDDVNECEHAFRLDTPLRSGLWTPLGDHGVMIVVSDEVGGFDQRTRQLADHLAVTTEATLDRVEREESLREHEHELTDRNRQLEDLNRMNGIIREIDQALVRATTRESIEQSVCELLTRDDRFAFAWIGRAVDGDRLAPRTWAGDGRGYLDAIPLAIDDDDGPPATRSAATGTVTLTPNVAVDLRSAPWRKAALARGLHSAISIPLPYAEMSYGVLTVFASEPNAFDVHSKEMFAELGETIANAMNSAETRRALLTDTVVELELRVREPDDVLGRLAREADCRIELGGTIPQGDGTARLFLAASGASAGAIRAVAEDVPSIERFDRIGGDDDAEEHRFELTVSGATIASTVVECGAAVRSIRATGSEIRVVVELPGSADVRTFVSRFRETYSDTELIARRDRERADRSRRAFEAAFTEELTDRQLEALETAYHSGYFEWPRERTGEEVAESLDITQPTFNAHLRSAERKLVAMVLDGPPPADGSDQHT